MIMSPGEGHEWGNPCWLEDRLKHVHVLHLHGVVVARSLRCVSWPFDGTWSCSSNAGCVPLPSVSDPFSSRLPPPHISPPLLHPHCAHASSVFLTPPHIFPAFLLSFTSENSCPFMQSVLFSSIPLHCFCLQRGQLNARLENGGEINKYTKKPGMTHWMRKAVMVT